MIYEQGSKKKSETSFRLFRVCTKKLIFLFINQNICYGYSKEPAQYETVLLIAQNIMFKLMGMKIFTILRSKICVYLNLCLFNDITTAPQVEYKFSSLQDTIIAAHREYVLLALQNRYLIH